MNNAESKGGRVNEAMVEVASAAYFGAEWPDVEEVELCRISMRHALQAAIAQNVQGEAAVGYLNVSRFRGSDDMVNYEFDYTGDLPDGNYPVYLHAERTVTEEEGEAYSKGWDDASKHHAERARVLEVLVDTLMDRALDAAAFLNALRRPDRAQPLRYAVHAIQPPLATAPSQPAQDEKRQFIELTRAEIQSGLDRVRHAEGLIRQLPADHDGRNTWLLNYGSKSWLI